MDYKDLEVGQTTEYFWFRARNELIEILMGRVCPKKEGLKIIDVGVGTGDDLKILSKFGSNYAVDIDEKALAVIDDDLCAEKKIADACNLPYPDNFFDVAVSFDVFEHIADDRKSASEIFRVLKDGGILFFAVPAFPFLFSSHDRALHHQRRYSRKSLRKLLYLFDEPKIYFWNSLLFFPMITLRILKKRSGAKVDKIRLSPFLNRFFYNLIKWDNFLISHNHTMPAGLSVVGYCFKKNK